MVRDSGVQVGPGEGQGGSWRARTWRLVAHPVRELNSFSQAELLP